MNPRVKTALLLLGFLATVAGIGTALYFVFFRGVITPTEPTTPTEPGGAIGGLPNSGTAGTRPEVTNPLPGTSGGLEQADTVARGGVTRAEQVTEGAGTFAAAGSNGSLNYYDASTGTFYTVDANGNTVELSSQTFPKAESVSWNASANKAVIEFPDGSNVVYDFATEKQVTLPAHWEDFQFSPVSDQILAKSMALDPNNRSLIISNTDGSNVQAVQSLGENADKVQVSWSPNDQVIAFSDTAEPLSGGFDRKLILPVGKEQENFRGLTVEGLGFIPNWSPDGKKLLYSASGQYSNYQPLLWVTDATASSMGENRRSLGINTWANKCAFASAGVAYCAVPQALPANAGLQPALAANIPDTLYRVDLSSGRVAVAAVPASPVTMTDVHVSPDGSAFFYRNPATGAIERIRLQ